MAEELAVLLMAYGTPGSLDEIEAYYADIRRGRKPSPEAVEALKEKYRRIGGKSPLLEITQAQALGLETKLREQGIAARVYFGMKHWRPYIRDVVPEILGNGHSKLVGIVLAPHYSEISTGGYKQALSEGLAQSKNLAVKFVVSWHDNPLFLRTVAENARKALGGLPEGTNPRLVFTAHSLPERVLANGDPYPTQLKSSCQAVANLLGVDGWEFAYQSAGRTGEKWLGPDLLEKLQELRSRLGSGGNVLIVPIGFVSDHLEILYDIDVEAREFAGKLRLNLARSESLNASPGFIETLASVVAGAGAGKV